MISQKDNPVEWVGLMYEFEDLIEHLNNLYNEVSEKGYIEDGAFDVDIGHLYSHLNTIWNSRKHVGTMRDEDIERYIQMPSDIRPM